MKQLQGTSGSRFSDEPLFDSVRIAATSASVVSSQEIVFFSSASGATGANTMFGTAQTKNFTDTSLEGTGGVIPNKSAFVCKAIGVNVGFTVENVTEAAGRGLNGTLAPIYDLTALLRGCDLFFKSQVEEQYLGRLEHWPYGGGPWVQAGTVANAASFGFVSNGFPALTAMRSLQKRLILPGGLTFKFSVNVRTAITINTASLPILFTVILRGFWIKPA